MQSPSGDGASPRRACTHQLRRILLSYWSSAIEDYKEHGTPFGPDEKALLVWFQYGQFTTRN